MPSERVRVIDRVTSVGCIVAGVLLAWPAIGLAEQNYLAINLGPVYPDLSAGLGSGGGQQVGETFSTSRFATVWAGSAASAVNLNPPGFAGSFAYATDGTTQVGYVYGATTNYYAQAAIWKGTAETYQNLNPAGAVSSQANGVGGDLVAGQQTSQAGVTHATLWDLTTSNVVDLNPAGASYSVATAVGGNTEVGYAQINGVYHAIIWNGTAENYIDVSPTSSSAFIYGASGNQQVGSWGAFQNAALWNGSQASYVNLNGSLAGSVAYATNGSQQVGEGNPVINGIAQGYHAMVWSGSSSYVDLSTFLPAPFAHSTSVAMGIDANGDIFGTAYYRYTSGQGQAFLWVPIPEPLSGGIVLAGLWTLMGRGRMRRR